MTHQAEYDVAVNRGFKISCPEGFVMVVDVGGARQSRKLIDYARCVNNLSLAEHNPERVYVVNSPRWSRAAWRVIRRFLDAQTARSVGFEGMHGDQFSTPEEHQLYLDLCRQQ